MPKSVLIIDDDIEIQRVFKLALRLSGYESYVTSSGTEALEMLKAIDPPGLIILDLTMPEMTGVEFLEHKAARAAIRDIPVVLCTAASHPKSIEGVTEVLEKPIDFDVLLTTVERFCG